MMRERVKWRVEMRVDGVEGVETVDPSFSLGFHWISQQFTPPQSPQSPQSPLSNLIHFLFIILRKNTIKDRKEEGIPMGNYQLKRKDQVISL